MKTIDQLREFYNTELQNEILAVEGKRKGIVSKITLVGVLLVATVIGSVYLIYSFNAPPSPLAWSICVVLVLGVLGFIAFNEIRNNKDFYNDFKFQVIERIVKFIDPSFTYISHKFILPSQLVESRLFAKVPKKYKGDDYVFGMLGGNTKIEFSEVVARQPVPDSNKFENTFKGLFFVAQVDRPFSGSTFVVPTGDTAETLMLGNNIQVQAMQTGNSQFDSFFTVYTSDAAEAKALLSDDVQRRLVDFRSSRTNPVRFSFVGSRINVAVWHEKDLFEPEVFKTLLDFGIIEEYYDDLYQAISVVEQITSRKGAPAHA
jgi:hypothetical protein